MNKKFTFMVAALLAAGSAFGQVAFDGKVLSDGKKVYLGTTTGTKKYLSAVKVTTSDSKDVYTFDMNMDADGAAPTDYSKATEFEVADYKVTGANTAVFSLKYDGKYVGVLSATGAEVSSSDASTDITYIFQVDGLSEGKVQENSTIKYVNVGQDLVENGLQLSSNTLAFNFGSGGTDVDFIVDAEKVLSGDGVDELNTHLGGKGFSLEYKLAEGQTLANTNIFAQPIKAFNLTTEKGAPVEGTYFATKYPADGKIESENEFKASTFIVLDPKGNYGFNDADQAAGKGFQFKTVTGKYITENGDVKTGAIPAVNAIFTVKESDPTNAPGKLTVSLGKVEYVKDNAYAEVSGDITYVGIISNMSKNYLTTVGATESTYKAELASSSIATAADLLKEEGPAVYTIKFTSGKNTVATTGSEYDKYLYSTSDGSDWSFAAEGTKYVDIKNPAAQWTISDYDSDTKVFTFRNRLSNDEIALSLNKLGNDEYTVLSSDEIDFAYGKLTSGNYAVDGSANFAGSTVKLTAVTIDKTAGFATIEDEKLNDVVTVKFNIPETPSTSGAFYVTTSQLVEGTNPAIDYYEVSGNIDETKAAKFQLVKFDGAASESEVVVSDTVYVDNGYKYWDADKEKVKESLTGDTLAYVTYAFKLVTNDGSDWYLSNAAVDYTTPDYEGAVVTKHVEGTEIPKFVLKENINGTYALIPAGYDNTDAGQDFVSATNAGVIEYDENLYAPTATNACEFVIEFGEPTPSLKAESKHVAFNTTLGYVAMNENAEGIIAPVSSLKAEYSKEDLTFWLDTADSKSTTPSFLISKAGKFMYNAVDSAYYYDSESATSAVNNDFKLSNGLVKAMFQTATLKDSETITVNEEDYTAANGLNNFKFQIVQKTEDSEGEYVIRSLRDYTYLTNSNGKLAFSSKENAMVVSVETMEAPTSNESVSASEVAVVAQNGSVVVKNAAGKNVVVSTILGQVVANEVLTSDNATINVPAGIVVVAVEGESFKINVR